MHSCGDGGGVWVLGGAFWGSRGSQPLPGTPKAPPSPPGPPLTATISAWAMLGAMFRMNSEQVLCRGRGLGSGTPPGAAPGTPSLGFWGGDGVVVGGGVPASSSGWLLSSLGSSGGAQGGRVRGDSPKTRQRSPLKNPGALRAPKAPPETPKHSQRPQTSPRDPKLPTKTPNPPQRPQTLPIPSIPSLRDPKLP